MPADIPPQIVNSFLIVMLVGIALALLLSHLANKKGSVESVASLKEKTEEKFVNSVFQEISKLPLSTQQQMEATEAIVNLSEKQLQKKIDGISRELNHKYEEMIEQKDRAAQILEENYKTANQKYEEVSKNFSKLGAEKRKSEAIVHAMAEGLVVINKKGEVLLMNPAAEKLLGVKKEEKIGKPILGDLKDEQMISLAKDISGSEEKEIVLQSQNENTKVVLKTSNAVIESEDGEMMGFVSVLSDVTKQKELDQMKSNFVGSVSHELRTPLNTIQESISLLLDQLPDNADPQQMRILSMAKRECERLARLINDLLDFHKIEANQLHLKPSLFNFNELLEHTKTAFDAWAKSKRINLKLKLPPEVIELEADRDRISQVITNLVGNALKFTPPDGTITLEACKIQHHESASLQFVRASVQDTGMGIPKKDQRRIFERFTQLGEASIHGAGIGLAIAREMVEFHGGKIWVDSEENAGSRFSFEIPLKFSPKG